MKLTCDERIILTDILLGDERDRFDIQETDKLASRGLVKIHECSDGDYVTVTPAGRAALVQGSSDVKERNMNMNGVWILTSENNDYDQHGEYFRAVFKTKPSIKELAEYFSTEFMPHSNVMEAVAFIEHVLDGGGRRGNENEWFNLRFVKFGWSQHDKNSQYT